MSEQQHPFVDYYEMDGKQHAMINLPTGYDGKTFRFGVSKAKLVVKYAKNIENFINKYGQSAKPQSVEQGPPDAGDYRYDPI